MYTGTADVMLYVKDLDRSVRFWRDALGLRNAAFWSDDEHRYVPDFEKAGAPCYAVLDAGGFRVALHRSDEPVPAGGFYLHLEVRDVDEAFRSVRARGVECGPPEDFPWGWRMFFVRDPDGHLVGLYTPRPGA
jgi:catechol 2,3-dioxygenase-like lactoylglutathione lyase family enzyme